LNAELALSFLAGREMDVEITEKGIAAPRVALSPPPAAALRNLS
jgi:hypothetical protein